MEAKSNLMKKPAGTKSVRESTRKQDVAHDAVGSFTQDLSYINEINGGSQQVVSKNNNNFGEQSLNP